jgi:uncharacterized membrane protein
MKTNNKLETDILILIVPVVVILLLYPVLPDKISIHRGINGTRTFIDRRYSFLLGMLPYIVYKIRYDRK